MSNNVPNTPSSVWQQCSTPGRGMSMHSDPSISDKYLKIPEVLQEGDVNIFVIAGEDGGANQ
jgi:hypothetical protein